MKNYFFTHLGAVLLYLFTPLQTIAQWHEQTSPTASPLYSVSVVDNSVAWIGGQSGIVLRTTDGGVTWTSVGGLAIGNSVYSIFGIDDQTALCAAINISPFGSGYVYKTTNGGSSWSLVYSKIGSRLHAVWMTSSSDGFLYGSPVNSKWELYNTMDGGATWSSAPFLFENGTEFGHRNSLFVSGSKIYFGTANSRIYHSGDSGNQWTPQATTQTNSYSIWFNDASNGLTGGESALNHTTDGGNTWNPVTTLPGSGSIDAITGVNNQWWAVRQSVIYNSVDNAASWSPQYSSPSSGIFNAMSKARNGNLIIAVRNDGGISAYLISLPVELSSFTASVNSSGHIVLNWITASEINNSGFEVERKVGNRQQWEKAGFVSGKGTTTETHYYSFIDEDIKTGSYSYRLKQVDFSGTFEYSKEVEVNVNMPEDFSLLQNYPNPFNPVTSILYSVGGKAGEQYVTLKIYDQLGRKVATLVDEKKQPGVYEVKWNAEGFSSGIYYYEMNSESFTSVKKLLLIK